MGRRRFNAQIEMEKREQIERGLRIKNIRENELKLNKTQLAEKLGISSQFLGLVEEGKGNLVYRSVKCLRELSGHSADYILYGLDDTVINQTKEYLEMYSEEEILDAIDVLKSFSIFMKNK